MMQHVKVLDCTLRDGAYLIDKKFGHTTIVGVIDGLAQSGIDCIEIGFFQDDGFGEGKTVFKNSSEAKKYVPDNKGNTLYTVLADYSRYSISNLDTCDGTSIDAVRTCFFKKERKDVLEFCRVIKEKGYKLFVQPVDILGYSDEELLDLIHDINAIEPYCFSIVDTFGSMYEDDLHHVFSLIDHNLIKTSHIGFHSHNNMQLSAALSQSFAKMSFGKRNVVIDGTLSGMGRGAGNTPTELILQYLVTKFGYSYNMDTILDVIDGYIENLKTRCSWGYSTPFFIAGCYSAHVNNIAYLMRKNCISSKEIRYILNAIGEKERRRYDYNLLEKTYLSLTSSAYDDNKMIKELTFKLKNQDVLVLVPGASVYSQADTIIDYIEKRHPIVISVNFIHEQIKNDFLFISNTNRIRYWSKDNRFNDCKRILTSNLNEYVSPDDYVVAYSRVIKCGWENMENATILLLRLLDNLGVSSIAIAGFDGYSLDSSNNYAQKELEMSNSIEDILKVNSEIEQMLSDFKNTRTNSMPVSFITSSRFEYVFD